MLLEKLYHNFKKYKNNTAFVINEKSFSYNDFVNKIALVQNLLFQNNTAENDIIAINTYNDIETYASIVAIWFSGMTFVPINPKHPKKRNELILNQINPKYTLSSNKNDKDVILTTIENSSALDLKIVKRKKGSNMYVLFTSGSTGLPKGVPINYDNLNAFITDFSENYELNEKDKFLQIYDLTFDASIHCYLMPLFLGGTIYTVSSDKIKYLEAYKIMDKYNITFAKFPPSVLNFLQPFFKKIKLPNLKYSLLGGESLNYTLIKNWQNCVPNAQIQNVYGPTEATINTHIFNIDKNFNAKNCYHGIVSIGRPFGSNKAIVIDENNNEVPNGIKGEMCLLGKQITKGYFNNTSKNKTSFFKINNELAYKTGDIVMINEIGNFLYCGRKDNQIQIQGFRVELSEIEQAARKIITVSNIVALSYQNKNNSTEIALFLEVKSLDSNQLKDRLKNDLPSYMIPKQLINVTNFPLTSSGKIDRKSLLKQYLTN